MTFNFIEAAAAAMLACLIGIYIGRSDNNDAELTHYKACVEAQATKEECDAIWWVREKYLSAIEREPHYYSR